MSKPHSHYDVIVSPVITEKSTLVSEANQVIFNVSPRATKTEIKAAIRDIDIVIAITLAIILWLLT